MSKKRKESFFERLTKKNQEQEENQKPKKAKKKTSWKIAVVGSLLTAAIVTGITVPLVVNSTKVTYKDPFSDDIVMFSFTDPNDKSKTVEIRYKDLKNSDLKNDAEKPAKLLEQLHRWAIFYLYGKEVEGSKLYQNIWNSSLTPDDNGKKDETIALKTISERKEIIKNKLLDEKEYFKKSYGTSNWETEFTSYLIKTYNGAKTVDEAVDYQILGEITNDALRSFRLVTPDRKKLRERVANAPIYDGANKIFSKGEKVFDGWYQNGVNYFVVDEDSMALETESYVFSGNKFDDKYKSANRFFDEFLNTDKYYIMSRFLLPGVAPTKAVDKSNTSKLSDWTVDRDAIRKLFFYYPAEDDAYTPTTSIKTVQDFFKPFGEYATEVATNGQTAHSLKYSKVLQLFSSDESNVTSNWGSKGIQSLTSLLNSSDETVEGLAIMKDILGDASHPAVIPEIDLFGELEKIRKDFLADPAVNIADVDPTKVTGNKEEKQKVIGDYCLKVRDFFKDKNKLTDELFDKLVTKKIEALFQNSEGQYRTLYKVKGTADTYIDLTSKGILLFNAAPLAKANNEETKKELINMIKNDFIISKKAKDMVGSRYNALNSINKNLTSSTYVNKILLGDKNTDPYGFKEYLKKQVNIYAKDANGQIVKNVNYTDDVINQLIDYNNNAYASDRVQKGLDLVTTLDKWFSARAESKRDLNLELHLNKVYFVNNNEGYKFTASDVIFNKLYK